MQGRGARVVIVARARGGCVGRHSGKASEAGACWGHWEGNSGMLRNARPPATDMVGGAEAQMTVQRGSSSAALVCTWSAIVAVLPVGSMGKQAFHCRRLREKVRI